MTLFCHEWSHKHTHINYNIIGVKPIFHVAGFQYIT